MSARRRSKRRGDEIITTIRNAVLASKAEGVGEARSSDCAPPRRRSARQRSRRAGGVELSSRFSRLNPIGSEYIIEDVTGLTVQATMRRSPEPRMAEQIADDVIKIF